MQFCQPHWKRLKAEVDKHGLSRMVLPGNVHFQQMVDSLKGKENENAPLDPLMMMHNDIIKRFLDPLGKDGLYIFTGEYCPLCELDRLNPGRDLPENWITTGTASLAKWLREKGLTNEILDETDLS